jgi:hypothetical protein
VSATIAPEEVLTEVRIVNNTAEELRQMTERTEMDCLTSA